MARERAVNGNAFGGERGMVVALDASSIFRAEWKSQKAEYSALTLNDKSRLE